MCPPKTIETQPELYFSKFDPYCSVQYFSANPINATNSIQITHWDVNLFLLLIKSLNNVKNQGPHETPYIYLGARKMKNETRKIERNRVHYFVARL